MKNNSNSNDNNNARRRFLKYAGGCAVASTNPFLATMANLVSTGSARAAIPSQSGYKAVVCIFQLGGNDSFNMLTPYSGSEYADYVSARGNLALSNGGDPNTDLLPVTDQASGRQFGIHPSMTGIRDLYNEGNAAFLANVGPLIQPVTVEDVQNKINVPLGAFSHNDSQQHWQTCTPDSRVNRKGWVGGMSDYLATTGVNEKDDFMNIALGDVNILQSGNSVQPYVVDAINGATNTSRYGDGSTEGTILKQMLDGLYAQSNNYNAMQHTLANINRDAIRLSLDFNDATSNGFDTSNFGFPNSSLGDRLAMVAKSIAARDILGVKRQTFYVGVGGWDLHSGGLNQHATLLSGLSAAMTAFYRATEALCVENDVTTFTVSDFGRTLSGNGNGTDHAWGGNHMIVGGSVKGGNVFGQYPTSLALGNPLDTGGRGRLIPTTSVDEYAAELALWLGVPNSKLSALFPNLHHFYNSSSSYPLGFMGQGKAEPCICTV